MSLPNNRSRIVALSRELQQEWAATREVWRDRKAGEFHHDYMQPLLDAVDNAARAMDDLDRILRKLKEDCEIE